MSDRMKILDVPQSGSQAGTTASRNRFGQYRRTRATPVNVNSSAQQDARNRLSAASSAWGALDDEDRAAWSYYADSHPITDSLGQSITLTGHQMFVSVNSALQNAGFDLVDAPDASAPPDAPALGAHTDTAAGFSFAFGTNPVPADTALVIETSPPLSPGRSFNGDFRVVVVRAAAAANTLLKAAMEAKWGTLVAGQKFFIRASYVTETGLRSAFEATVVTLT
jgi:hypothetical protein